MDPKEKGSGAKLFTHGDDSEDEDDEEEEQVGVFDVPNPYLHYILPISDFYGNIFGASYAKSKTDRGTKNLAVGTRMYL